MRNNKIIFVSYLILIVLSLISTNDISNSPITITPNKFVNNIQIRSTEKILFQAFRSEFKPNHFYRIMVHYLGSLGIEMNIRLICDRILEIPSIILENNGGNNIRLNDYDEIGFKTDPNGFPSEICEDSEEKFNREKFLIEIQPKFIAYQTVNIKNLIVNLAIEIVESKYNTDIKPIGILTDKNLYISLIATIGILFVLLCLLRNRLKSHLQDYVMLNTSRSHHDHTH